MFINASRPLVGAYPIAKTIGPNRADIPSEKFTSGTNTRVAEIDALAAFAQISKTKVTAELPKELAQAVTAEFGESGITTLADERVTNLKGYLIEGWEAPFFDPLATLGEGWEGQSREGLDSTEPYAFSRLGEGIIQHLSFDQREGTTALRTIHSESFISTRHYEVIQDRDGKVTVSDEAYQ